MIQNNAGVKGNTQARAMERNISRELKRKEPQSTVGGGDICASIVTSNPFSKNSERRRDDELRGGPQVGMGKAKISSDSRTQDLISDKNPKLDYNKQNRAIEHGGFREKSDMQQGNVTGSKGKGFNKANETMNSDDSI